MKSLYLRKQLGEIEKYPIAVINSIYETIDILNKSYKYERDVESDLGGYVILAENISDR